MHKTTRNTFATAAAATLSIMGVSTNASAGDISINYDRLSFIEEPIAFDVFGFTTTYKQLSDVAVEVDKYKDDADVVTSSFFEVNIERQLPNSLTIGGSYLGAYQNNLSEEYTSSWAAYVSGVWGAVLIGDVVGVVREDTRRLRGEGNASLEFDDFFGLPDETGAAYRGRYSAFVATGSADDDGNYDLGLSYRRPNEYVDHRFSLRHTKGELLASDGTGFVETKGFAFVNEFVYGSLLVDASIGYERLEGQTRDEDRLFTSFGANLKINALSLSVEGHYGEIADGEEVSFSAGGRFDIARGASLNVGYNYSDIDANLASLAEQTSKVIVSLRYEY